MCTSPDQIRTIVHEELDNKLVDFMEKVNISIDTRLAHTKPAPETQEMLGEWKKVKWAAFMLLFAIGGWVATIQLTINYTAKEVDTLTAEMKENEEFHRGIDISTTEIKTKLANIEAILQEIKTKI